MATRFYLTNAATTYTPSGSTGAWDDVSSTVVRLLDTTKSGAATSVAVAESVKTNNWDVRLGRWVTRRIQTAGTLQGGITAAIAAQISSTTPGATLRMVIYVETSAGAIRGTALNTTSATLATTATGRSLSGTATSVSCQVGDRIVVEVGYVIPTNSSTSYTGTAFYGGTAGTDMSSGDTDTSHPAWIEFADAGIPALFTVTASVTYAGAGSMTTAGTRERPAAVTFAGAGSFGANAVTNAVSMSGSGLMSVEGTRIGPLDAVWTAPTIAVPEGKIYGSQVVFDYTLLEPGQTVTIKSTIDNGLTWQAVEDNYGPIPRLAPDSDFTRAIMFKAELHRPDGTQASPRLHELAGFIDVNGTLYHWIPLGVFTPSDVTVTESKSGIEVSLDADDLSSKVSDNSWETIKTFPKDTNLGDVVKAIILDRYPAAEFDFETTTATALATLTLGAQAGGDPFADAAKIARKAGMVLYVNYKGIFCMRSPVDPDAAPVVGTLTDAARPIITELTRALTKEGTANRVVIEGESVNGSAPVRAQVDDTDPTSPNRIDGSEGIKTYRAVVKGVDQNTAMTMAQAEALKRKGALETEELDLVPQYQYEEGDVVLLDRSTVGASGRYLLDSFNLPFGAGGNQHTAARRRALEETSGGGNVGGLDGEEAPSTGGGGGGGGTTLRTYSTPGECHKIGTNGNLNHYKIQTAFTGDSDITERSQSQIGAGYSNSPEYCMTADRTAVQMRVNLNAPTTSGSSNPRTEYREMDSNGTSTNGWSPANGIGRQSTFRVTHAPANNQSVCCMQIHDESDDVLQILTAKVSGVLKIGYKKNGGSFVAIDNYTIGNWVTVRWMYTSSSNISIWYHTGIDPVFSGAATTTISSVSHSGNCYAKIGTYPQSTSSESSSDYASAEFKKLGMYHPGYPDPVYDSDYLDSSGAGQVVIGFGACINASDSSMLGLLAGKIDWWFMLGDTWYKDGATQNWQADWNQKFSQTNYAALLDSLPNPQVVLWSDHDFGYANNSTGLDNPSRTAAANSAYRAQFGSSGPNVQGATLPPSGIYRTFDIGRIKVVCLDMLTFKSKLGSASSTSRTMLGSTQKSWYKNILAHPTQPVVLVFGDGQIPGPAEDDQDEWRGYAAERSELASAVSASPATVIYCNGDTHSLAYGHNQFGYDRVWQSAPLNNATKVKAGGEGYLGQYPTNDTEGPTKQMAAAIVVVDNGTSISLTYRGYEGTTERLTDSITVNA